ncbi:PREDICTED: receptor-type tyrosine-protein phosphatase N2 isoform X1 [Habropoda laboriosa]|uniref:receptor-type tyrosine-protein phosphatase N2 isoform X1 n=1 Tax=Habropoda laboriosa TaxID=597456 RepID=UPI00083DC7BD|nr:PREDICTED: receptor-type tyrosine-protein phosphatase N2 isoform X1 [Habropoda laboriosa]
MGRKRWWRGGSELMLLFILHHVILGDGDVGCLFSKSLCDPRTETCYNDLAFGRCLPLYTDLNDGEYYKYNFNVDELELLRLQLERLQIDGYKWSHPYTQCIMQTSLYNLRHGENYDLRLCQHLKQRTRFENKNELDQARAPTIAIVKFTPNNSKFNSQFANELYYPPGTRNQYFRESLYNDEFSRTPYKEEPRETNTQYYRPRYNPNTYNEYESLANEESYDESNSRQRPSSTYDEGINERLYRTRRQPYNLRDYDDAIESIKTALDNEEELSKKYSENENVDNIDTLTADELEYLVNDKSDDYANSQKDKGEEDNLDVEYEKEFSRKYKPRKFELPDKDSFILANVKRNSKNDYDSDDYDDVNDDELPQEDSSSIENGIYTEGGLVQATNDKSNSDTDDETAYDTLFDDDLSEILWRRGLAGFKRRERLDVKKPGPPFSTNNYAFKTPSPSNVENENSSDSIENGQDNDVLFTPYVKKEAPAQQTEGSKTYNNVDLDHVYVEFQQQFHTWSEGEHVVTEVGKLLGLTPGSLKDIRVGRAEVTFKVVKNNKSYNATDVVDKIDDIRGKLKETLGVEVIRAGIGDKVHLETRLTKLPATLEVNKKSEMSSSMFGAIIAAGVVAAGAAAVVTLIIARRHAKARAKLAGLNTPDPEISKDYQALCRARMHAKQPTDKPESLRITNLSRESETSNAPSNRSSTSSWGEETAAASNMDIATGQMVLSYMEDHLKNKDRLDQEWAALCAYEVDPCSTETAESEANAACNRPGAALPYDHSRVILNDLANANHSDYINASTIKSTDHDPRNPAYIATQGPLPQTAADFWQLVWEQGSVVIVMLTRLTEEGVGMCHRYWPEEGSELYHMYEVHLVSEHFWCDDYLVRSFYLKNQRTGETRTVTQFHFLSWPENGVPQSIKALLEFRRKINKSYKGRSCPIVVHCSDGAGRTGTYCLIDMVLNRMMKGAKEIDIAATLEHIRDQRPDMVATKQQFKFVLTAVAEEVHAVLKALPVPPAEKSPLPENSTSTKEGQ